jgi:hypothetical protein
MIRVQVHTGIWWGNLREGDHLEDRDIDRKIILKWILETKNGGGKKLIYLTQDRDM